MPTETQPEIDISSQAPPELSGNFDRVLMRDLRERGLINGKYIITGEARKITPELIKQWSQWLLEKARSTEPQDTQKVLEAYEALLSAYFQERF